MVRCEEFYKKWDSCGNFCEKHPNTAAQIEAYLDQMDEIEEITADCLPDVKPSAIAEMRISENACRPLIREKDPEVRREVIKQIVKKSEEKAQTGARPTVTSKEVKKILADVKRPEPPKPELTKNAPRWEGSWLILGKHKVFCGDCNSEEFKAECKGAKFAFSDPPYNAGVAEWDHDFTWAQDWLADLAPIVAVTPGIVSIQDFFKSTNMPYAWSVACLIKNGMTRGALGFGNWIYVSLFSKESLFRTSQDYLEVSIKTSETEDSNHKGRKPLDLLKWLLERFSKPGDVVIDPFLGSGTTLIACEKMGRTCIGAEISREYCEAIGTRWLRENTI